MSENVIRLPRPHAARAAMSQFGLYLRVGRNQHRDLLEVLGSGVSSFHGIVLDAGNIERHKELHSRALDLGLDVVLDPKTHAMATPGGFTPGMSSLPWGRERHHTVRDFEGDAGFRIASQIADVVAEHNFTQVLGPAHLLNGANDQWLRRDIDTITHLRRQLDACCPTAQLIYPLAMPMQVLRDPLQRAAIAAAVADAPMDAIWLRIDNFGSDATGEKTVAYIEAAREFHSLGVPVIADHAGGISGLGAVAFEAVGGLAHGITFLEGFKASKWKHIPKQDGDKRFGQATRVYIPRLDMLLKPDVAKAFLGSSSRTHGRYGCRDSHCCPGGVKDMLANPMRHFIHQRSSDIIKLSGTPESIRVSDYLEHHVRAVSDDVSAACGLSAIDDDLKNKLVKKQAAMGRFRQTIGHFAEIDKKHSAASLPQTRNERANSK